MSPDKPKTPEQQIEKLVADQARRIAELEAALRDIHRETNSSHEAREIIGYVRQTAATALKP